MTIDRPKARSAQSCGFLAFRTHPSLTPTLLGEARGLRVIQHAVIREMADRLG